MKDLGKKARHLSKLMSKASYELIAGHSTSAQGYIDQINVLLFRKAIHVYIDGSNRVCVNIPEHSFRRIGNPFRDQPNLPLGMTFMCSQITKYYMDGRVEVLKDRYGTCPRWIVDHQACDNENEYKHE